MATRVLFVCLGNICRSPTAEGVARHLIAQRGLGGQVEVDSAGTGGWHIGDPPDPRATAAAARRGITLSGAARQLTVADFHDFDLLLAMDGQNLVDMRAMAPAGTEQKVRQLAADDVPDPYYGGTDGFDRVVAIVEEACRALLDDLLAAR